MATNREDIFSFKSQTNNEPQTGNDIFSFKSQSVSPLPREYDYEQQIESGESAPFYTGAGLRERGSELVNPEGGFWGAAARVPLGFVGGATGLFKGARDLVDRYIFRVEDRETLTDELNNVVEEAIARTGGRDMYSGLGQFAFDLIPITRIESAVVKTASKVGLKLSTRTIKELSKEFHKGFKIGAKALAQDSAKNAAKLGTTGFLFESAREGSLLEGLRAMPGWAVFGAATPTAGLAVSGFAKMAKKSSWYKTAGDLTRKLEYNWITESAAFKKFAPEKFREWVLQQGAKKKAIAEMEEVLGERLAYFRGKNEVVGVTEKGEAFKLDPLKAISDLAEADRTSLLRFDSRGVDADVAFKGLSKPEKVEMKGLMAKEKLVTLPRGQEAKEALVYRQMSAMKKNPETAEMAANIENVADGLRLLSERTIKYFGEKGLFTEKQIRNMMDANPLHVPIMRVIDQETLERWAAQGRGKGATPKRLIGSEREIRNVMVNVIDNYTRMKPFADRMEFKRDIIHGINDDASKLIDGTMKDATVEFKGFIKDYKGTSQKMYEAMDKAGIKDKSMRENMLKETHSIFRTPTDLKNNEIAILNAGKWEKWQVNDEILLDFMKTQDPQSGGWVVDFVKSAGEKMKGYKRAGITLMPDFMIRNGVRDFMMSLIVDPTISGIPVKFWGQAMYRLAYDYPRVALDPFINKVTARMGKKAYQKAYDAYLLEKPGDFNGAIGVARAAAERYETSFSKFKSMMDRSGAHGATWHGKEEEIMSKMAKMSGSEKITILPRNVNELKMAAKAPAQILDWLENFSMIIEQTPRLIMGERAYNTHLKLNPKDLKGARLEAARVIREATTNFSEMGAVSREWGRYIPFLTASIGGPRTLARATAKNPIGVAAKTFQLITVPAMFLWAKNHNEDWYKALNPMERDMYFHVSEKIRIPKPFDLGVIGGTMIERMMDQFYEFDPEVAEEAAKNMAKLLLPGVPLPPAVEIAVGLGTNKNMFFGTPIESPYQKQALSPHMRAGLGTSEMSKDLVKRYNRITDPLDLSAPELDYIVNTVFGSMGRYGMKFVDAQKMAARKRAGETLSKPSKDLSEYPGFGAMFKKSPLTTTYTSHMKRFYEFYGDTQKVYNDIHQLDKMGRFAEADAKIKSIGYKADIYEYVLREAADDINELTQLYREISQPDLYTEYSPDEKRKILDDIAVQMNGIAEMATKDYKYYMKEWK